MRDFSKYFDLDYMVNRVKKIVIVKKWYLGSKIMDVDAEELDREELHTSDDYFKKRMEFMLGELEKKYKLSKGVIHRATGVHRFEFDAVDLDKRGRQLKVEMYYEEY